MKKTIIILCLLGDPVMPAASYDRTGGFNVDMLEILKYWSDSPYSIIVITNTSFYAPKKDEQLYENIQIHRVFLEDDILNSQPQLARVFPRVLQETVEYIDNSNLQPLFFHSYYWYSGLLALKLSQMYEVNFLHSVVALAIDKKLTHSPNFCSVQYDFENTFLLHASYIMAISNSEKQTLIKYYNCSEEKIMVVGRSVDNAFLLPDHDNKGISNSLIQNNEQKWNLYLKEDVSYNWWYHGAFTYIGRIKNEKGVGNIIEAWYQLYLNFKGNIPPLWLVGGQPDTITPLRNNFAERYPDFLNLEKEMKICWWGYLTPASINAVLLKTAAVVTHSQYEAGGRVIIEALSAGKPVIATPTGFAADLIKNWKNGFLVPFDNIALLKKRMEHFIKQPLISNPLGEYARITFQKAAENWHYYEQHREIYQHLSDGCLKRVSVPKMEDIIFEQIPDFFHKKLLYSWPDEKEIEKKIVSYIREKWHIDVPILTYCNDLSHHSFIWKLNIAENSYYIKHIYTTFNDAMLWNEYYPSKYVYQASDAYEIAINTSTMIEIVEKEPLLKLYITKSMKQVSPIDFFENYKAILQKLYIFDTSSIYNYTCFTLDTYTYEQILEFVFDGKYNNSELYKFFLPVLKKPFIPPEIATSYGKEFSWHIVYTLDGYKLLPSSTTCRAPLGIDAAVFLNELLNASRNIINPQKFYILLCEAAEIFHIPAYSLLRLCMIVKLLILKKQNYLFEIPESKEDIIFWKELLFSFKNSNYPKSDTEHDNA